VEGDSLRLQALEHIWFQSVAAWEDVIVPDGMRVMVSGEGSHLRDSQGKIYLNCMSGLWLTQVGYGRKEIAAAIAEQAARLQYTSSTHPTEPTIRLAVKLAQMTPGSLSRSFFVSGGAEANETALKIALQYHHLNGDRKRYKIIGRRLSYHGGTFATMSIVGARGLDRVPFEPLFSGGRLMAGPYCYRCDYGLEYPACALLCARELERVIETEGPDTVAAFIGEPISNSSGVSVPPPRLLADHPGHL
jgi:adenosylmethionine-8-amino-7-oxononanoate aminotransferase